ncbi:PorT family protein [Labilibacter sediminis]|nr:PorT family protein [Labilibacter sediminis]
MMKKFLLLFMIAGLVVSVSAQDRIAVGLKTGFNSTKINLSSIPTGSELKNEAKGGFLIGAYGKLRLSEKFYIQPEVYYAKKNTEYAFVDVDDVHVKDDGTIHTWDIPLLARLDILDLKVARVYGIAGPVASFISKVDFDELQSGDFSSTNWSLQAGGGAEFWRLTADVRYEWGLKDISDIPTLDIGQKTGVLTFTVGFKLLGL